MTDFCDDAQRITELELERLLCRRGATAPALHAAPRCEACDDEIPQGRRDAVRGVRLCIACATALETRNRR